MRGPSFETGGDAFETHFDSVAMLLREPDSAPPDS